MFGIFSKRHRLAKSAERYFKAGEPIPLDLFVECLTHGVDITALERKARNG